MTLEKLLVGKRAKANHPITCLNPDETFIIFEVRAEYRTDIQKTVVQVRGENTMWWGNGAWELVE